MRIEGNNNDLQIDLDGNEVVITIGSGQHWLSFWLRKEEMEQFTRECQKLLTELP